MCINCQNSREPYGNSKLIKIGYTIAGSPGCFSSRGDARVIWAGLAGNIDVLKTLQAGLSMGLKRHGYVEDKHFQAHLTLGREGMNLPLYKELSSAWKWNSDMRFEVRNIILFSSELRSGGPIYSEVAAKHSKVEEPIPL